MLVVRIVLIYSDWSETSSYIKINPFINIHIYNWSVWWIYNCETNQCLADLYKIQCESCWIKFLFYMDQPKNWGNRIHNHPHTYSLLIRCRCSIKTICFLGVQKSSSAVLWRSVCAVQTKKNNAPKMALGSKNITRQDGIQKLRQIYLNRKISFPLLNWSQPIVYTKY